MLACNRLHYWNCIKYLSFGRDFTWTLIRGVIQLENENSKLIMAMITLALLQTLLITENITGITEVLVNLFKQRIPTSLEKFAGSFLTLIIINKVSSTSENDSITFFFFLNYICQFCLVRISQLSNEDRGNNYIRLVGPLPALGTNVPRGAGVVRLVATVSGESVPDSSRVFSFRSTCVCVGCTLLLTCWYCLTGTYCTSWLVDKFVCMFYS